MTFVKLKEIEKQLKKLKLYNTHYLHKRDNTYYFVIRLDENTVYRKSLKTSNLTYSIILKLKIIRYITMNDLEFGNKLLKK